MTRSTRTVFVGIVLLLMAGASFAHEERYNCNLIPEEMKKNANAVVRDFHEEIQIKSPHEIYIKTRIAITILNEKGKNYGVVNEGYDLFRKAEHIDGRLYDKNGDEIQALKQKSIKDYGAAGSLFLNDVRVKYFEFEYNTYPYTCVYEIEKKLNYSFRIPSWMPRKGFDCSVEKADVEVIYPKGFPLRYRTFHIGRQPVSTIEDGMNKLSLSVSEMEAGHKPDEFTPLHSYSLPALVFAADKFEFDEREGGMATWNDFGKFYYKLNENRDELPEEMVKTVHRLTDTCHSDLQKINVLYEYLKKNTRYVALELGIGGWQTLDAKFVAEKGYADCKGLSNYMKSMLKVVGINSFHVLVSAGDKEPNAMIPDFPYNEFNHDILCAVVNNDTIWMECTSKTLPAGYLSSFTSNRHVLLVTPDGGYMIRTPDYKIDVNTAGRSADIYINEKNEMHGTVNLKYSGYMWDREYNYVVDQPKSKVDNYLNTKFPIPSYTIGNYTIRNDISKPIPSVSESVSLSGSGNVSASGKDLFVSTAILPLHIPQPESYEPRKKPFHIFHSYMVTDTITIHLNDHYTMSAPAEKKLDVPFADYWYKAILENDSTLKVTALYAQQEGDYFPEQYADYLKLSKEVNNNAASDKIVLTRKD